MIYFALGTNGIMYNLCDCGDFEAAEESVQDIIGSEGYEAVWIADEFAAWQWYATLDHGLPRRL